MTPLEQQVWAAVYAVAWFQPTAALRPGHVPDEQRAEHATKQADRAVRALVEHVARAKNIAYPLDLGEVPR